MEAQATRGITRVAAQALRQSREPSHDNIGDRNVIEGMLL